MVVNAGWHGHKCGTFAQPIIVIFGLFVCYCNSIFLLEFTAVLVFSIPNAPIWYGGWELSIKCTNGSEGDYETRNSRIIQYGSDLRKREPVCASFRVSVFPFWFWVEHDAQLVLAYGLCNILRVYYALVDCVYSKYSVSLSSSSLVNRRRDFERVSWLTRFIRVVGSVASFLRVGTPQVLFFIASSLYRRLAAVWTVSQSVSQPPAIVDWRSSVIAIFKWINNLHFGNAATGKFSNSVRLQCSWSCVVDSRGCSKAVVVHTSFWFAVLGSHFAVHASVDGSTNGILYIGIMYSYFR